MLFSAFALLGAIAAPFTAALPVKEVHRIVTRGETYNGRTTFYTPGDSDPHTACQDYFYSDGNDKIVALSMSQFDTSLCGQTITVNYQGKSVTATIRDGCETCSFGQIDLSPGAMAVLDSNYKVTGQFDASWTMNGGGGGGNKDQPTSTKEKTTETPPPPPETTSTQETSTWSPSPTPTSTWTPPPSSSTTSTPPPSSSVIPSSSIVPSSSISANATSALLNATLSLNATMSVPLTASLNATANVTGVLASVTQAAAVAVITTGPESDNGNIAKYNNYVANLGSLVIAAVNAL